MQRRVRLHLAVRTGYLDVHHIRHGYDRQCDERTRRQINARCDDDHSHAESRRAVHAGLAQEVFQIAERVKLAAVHHERKEREHDDEREKTPEDVAPT